MSEWERNDRYGPTTRRAYAKGLRGFTASHEACSTDGPYRWGFHVEESLWSPGASYDAATEAEAQADCDAAAVAWVLIALAKRAAAWARDVDAELARCYRAAAAHYRALSGADADAMAACAGEIILAEARIDMDDAHAALMRGYP